MLHMLLAFRYLLKLSDKPNVCKNFRVLLTWLDFLLFFGLVTRNGFSGVNGEDCLNKQPSTAY